MPIMLENLDLSASQKGAKRITPKFFSSKLTGSGKGTGLLNTHLRPINAATNKAYSGDEHIEIKRSHSQNEITTSRIPLGPLLKRVLTSGGDYSLPVPHVDEAFTVEVSNPQSPWQLMFDMTPQAISIFEDTSGQGTVRDVVIQYRMELHAFPTGGVAPTRSTMTAMRLGKIPQKHQEMVFTKWDSSPMENAREFISEHAQALGLRALNLDDELDLWMAEYSIHERITRLAEIWSSDEIAEVISQFLSEMPANPSDEQMSLFRIQLRYLENYNVPLEAYFRIHDALKQRFADAEVTSLSKQNLSLLMNHTLSHLDQLKPQLVKPGTPDPSYAAPAHFSPQQRAALMSDESLVMTQAGAGTGKSTLILERIAYLVACGAQPSDITVLSFTNAAADNINERNPAVGSMTIARMIIDIYSLNHPTHQVSSLDTIINSLDIFYPHDQVAAKLRWCLSEVDKGATGAFTALNTFIENHFDAVISILDRIQQTSLELQIVICYQRIDVMQEPAHVQSKFLIIDEVQDNSVFETIYLLKYIAKHQQSLFIVGDASQTLFEFRSANPRALNTLEGSGVFATYQLSTNYRSNQEILDFANVTLRGLETNAFANIQLQANSLVTPTAETFQEKVHIDYRHVPRLSTFVTEELSPIVQNTIVPDFVRPALAKKEQVAFLARTRREVGIIKETLEKCFPGMHVASLVSDLHRPSDIFSRYIKEFWNDVMQVLPQAAPFTISDGIRKNLAVLAKNTKNPEFEKAVLSMVSDWWITNQALINGWLLLVQQGQLSVQQYFEQLRDNVLSFEIQRNQKRLNITKLRNSDRKQKNLDSNAELVVSTIHGAKGLEFAHTVVLYKEDTQMSEADRRIYYVAFTRAMQSQYVLAYGTVKNPPLEVGYSAIVGALTERDEALKASQAGVLVPGPDTDVPVPEPAMA